MKKKKKKFLDEGIGGLARGEGNGKMVGFLRETFVEMK